jgi:hypothetical protein
MVCSFEDPEKIKEWTELCRLMKETNPVVRFCFKPTELFIQMKHKYNQSVLEITFPASWFSFYEWKDTEFDVSTESLFTIFSRYSGEKNISMDAEKKYLWIKCFHEKHHKHYSIPLLHQYYKPIMVHMDIGIEFKIESLVLYTLCHELSTVDDRIFFRIKPEYFHMIAEHDEKMVIEVQSTMFERILDGSYENRFYVKFLLPFLKYASLFSSINVQFGNLLCFHVEKEYQLRYYVCPIKS